MVDSGMEWRKFGRWHLLKSRTHSSRVFGGGILGLAGKVGTFTFSSPALIGLILYPKVFRVIKKTELPANKMQKGSSIMIYTPLGTILSFETVYCLYDIPFQMLGNS